LIHGSGRRGSFNDTPPPRALSSLFKHLVRHGTAIRNPVVDVERPTINRVEGSTAAFSKIEARKLLDAPPADTLAGLRERAILSVGLQVGFRRAEIAALNVGDLHQNRGFDALRVIRKGGRREALAINPQTAQRIRAYLDKTGHGDQPDAPLFRPLRGNAKPLNAVGRMDADAIDRMVRKYAAEIGLARGYLAHSMRATFITTALENGAQLEDVQKAAGHRDPSTTKLYDRRGYNPEKAASFLRPTNSATGDNRHDDGGHHPQADHGHHHRRPTARSARGTSTTDQTAGLTGQERDLKEAR
jgi:integrase/recombinase XerD